VRSVLKERRDVVGHIKIGSIIMNTFQTRRSLLFLAQPSRLWRCEVTRLRGYRTRLNYSSQVLVIPFHFNLKGYHLVSIVL
jgi:hypothetical protein